AQLTIAPAPAARLSITPGSRRSPAARPTARTSRPRRCSSSTTSLPRPPVPPRTNTSILNRCRDRGNGRCRPPSQPLLRGLGPARRGRVGHAAAELLADRRHALFLFVTRRRLVPGVLLRLLLRPRPHIGSDLLDARLVLAAAHAVLVRGHLLDLSIDLRR